MLATVALGILLRGGIELIWSQAQLYPAASLGIKNVAIAVPGGGRISIFGLALILSAASVYAALLLFLRFGRWGVRMRAAGQSPLLAAQRGLDLHKDVRARLGLSPPLLEASLGMLIAMDSGLSGTMAIIGLKAFPAALVGGLDSLVGALLGSLVISAARGAADPLRRSAAVRCRALCGV